MPYQKKPIMRTHLFFKQLSTPLKPSIFALYLVFAACHKDPLSDTTPPTATTTDLAAQRTEMNTTAVIAMAQWMIDHHVPLVADPAAQAELAVGHYTAPAVQTKLASLGFTSYNGFALEYEQVTATVRQAISDGILTPSIISDILQSNFNQLKFNALPEGDPDALKVPCYKQFVDDLAMGMVAVAGAAAGGPWAAAGAAAVTVAGAYINFKNCLEQYG